MRNPARAILSALLIAIPAPFILGFVLVAFTPEVFQIMARSGSSDLATNTPFILGSVQGISAYILAFLVFGVTGLITVIFAQRQPAPAQRSQGSRSQPSANRSYQQQDDDGDYDDDDDSPEGDEEGTVKWFNVKKGFGFIVRDSGDEVFVHFRAIRGRGRRVLRQGQLVRFNVVEAEKGLQADNVSILSD